MGSIKTPRNTNVNPHVEVTANFIDLIDSVFMEGDLSLCRFILLIVSADLLINPDSPSEARPVEP